MIFGKNLAFKRQVIEPTLYSGTGYGIFTRSRLLQPNNDAGQKPLNRRLEVSPRVGNRPRCSFSNMCI